MKPLILIENMISFVSPDYADGETAPRSTVVAEKALPCNFNSLWNWGCCMLGHLLNLKLTISSRFQHLNVLWKFRLDHVVYGICATTPSSSPRADRGIAAKSSLQRTNPANTLLRRCLDSPGSDAGDVRQLVVRGNPG